MKEYSHVFEPTLEDLKDGFFLKGKWGEEFFHNNNPIILELGCGMGEYSVGLAEKNPDNNYIGIDIKGARMWQGATTSINMGMKNIGFLRIRIEWIEYCFSAREIDEIWITFPDPQLKKSRQDKRLTHPTFLDRYKKIVKNSTIIHLKADSQFLHGFTLGVIESKGYKLLDSTNDLYSQSIQRENVEIKTHYEKKFLKEGLPITYLSFIL